MALKPAPATTYIVEVFDKPKWVTVLTTKNKAEAEEALRALEEYGRMTEITPKRK